MNTIRTVLPRSTRQAAHSPPRHPPKSPVIEIDHGLAINQIPMIVTDDGNSPPVNKEKTIPKAIKDSSSVKCTHRNSDGLLTGCSSDPIDSEEIHSTSVPRR